MINRKKDIINILEMTVFMVLVLLLISFFFGDLIKQDNQPVQNIFISLSVSNTQNAVTVDAIKLPLYKTCWISLIDKSNFTFFNEGLKIVADNKKISLRINSILKTQQKMKPPVPCGFYRYLFPIDNDELPDLS